MLPQLGLESWCGNLTPGVHRPAAEQKQPLQHFDCRSSCLFVCRDLLAQKFTSSDNWWTSSKSLNLAPVPDLLSSLQWLTRPPKMASRFPPSFSSPSSSGSSSSNEDDSSICHRYLNYVFLMLNTPFACTLYEWTVIYDIHMRVMRICEKH